jgi:hypothetical protein
VLILTDFILRDAHGVVAPAPRSSARPVAPAVNMPRAKNFPRTQMEVLLTCATDAPAQA